MVFLNVFGVEYDGANSSYVFIAFGNNLLYDYYDYGVINAVFIGGGATDINPSE